MKNVIPWLSLALAIQATLAFPVMAQTELDPKFNPNNIISDEEMLNYRGLSRDEIQKFLENHNSYLATYYTISSYGQTKLASDIIYDASVNNYDCDGAVLSDSPTEEERIAKCQKIGTVNPKFLLVLLQKEQSLIDETAPTQKQLDWATGYGCPDNAYGCNPYYKGFGKQVNSASLQFLAYVNEQEHYSYRFGQTYTFTNPYGTISTATMEVTPQNKATAALYNYTPHVFNGNYNFYKLWKKFFPLNSYPDGTLLQADGEAGVWLLENGQKRPFLTHGALTSRFDEKKIVIVDKDELAQYPKGADIKFPNYSILRSTKGKLYLLVDSYKRPFASKDVFKKIGYSSDEIIDASDTDLAAYADGKEITAKSAYLSGALLQDKKTGGVYWVINDTKAPIIDRLFLKTKFKNKKIIPTTTKELDAYTKIEPIKYASGELLKTADSAGVFLIDGNRKRPFSSGEAFVALGYDWKNIITVSPQMLALYDNGEAVAMPVTATK